MFEAVVNLHIHSRYTDGTGSHADIARAAAGGGLDAVIVTDHNVRVAGREGYVQSQGKKVLLLVGEEVHDRTRTRQKDHLLVLAVKQELSALAEAPDELLAAVHRGGGLSFLALPVDPEAPRFHETDISWENWSVSGYTGIELWNGFSELKAHLHTRLHGFFLAFFPSFVAHGPMPGAVQRWDELVQKGRVVAIGGSDAHALEMRAG